MGTPAIQEDNIYDLTARESARCRPHVDLLIDAFADIAQGKLKASFEPENDPLSFTIAVGLTWRNTVTRRNMLAEAVQALQRNPRFFARWFRCVLVTYDDYLRWRRGKLTPTLSAKSERPPRASDRSVLRAIKDYLGSEQTKGRAGSEKRAWEYAKVEIEGAAYKHVIDALRKLKGRKGRGRPRKRQPS